MEQLHGLGAKEVFQMVNQQITLRREILVRSSLSLLPSFIPSLVHSIFDIDYMRRAQSLSLTM